jgi:hypothetical protein
MELGYTDFGQIRTDPDLDFLRKDPRFEVRTEIGNSSPVVL